MFRFDFSENCGRICVRFRKREQRHKKPDKEGMKRMIRRIIVLVIAALMLACIGVSLAEEAWLCPVCGNEASGNFCSNCGTARDAAQAEPEKEQGEKTEPAEGVRLDLYVSFEKNAWFSTYDVKLYLDDEWITTIRHGADFEGSLTVAPGKHVVAFEKDTDSSVKGTSLITVTDPVAYSCGIEAKHNTVRISGEQLSPVSADDPVPGGEHYFRVDGDLRLAVTVEFEKNALLSAYDVDFYVDDIKVAELPHGKDFTGILGLSEGKHYLYFFKAGDSSVRGSAEITVTADTAFSCRITASRNRIKVTRQSIK